MVFIWERQVAAGLGDRRKSRCMLRPHGQLEVDGLQVPEAEFVGQNWSILTWTKGVRTRSDTIPINSNPEPYLLISQPHLNLAIPFPVSLLRIRSSHLVSL